MGIKDDDDDLIYIRVGTEFITRRFYVCVIYCVRGLFEEKMFHYIVQGLNGNNFCMKHLL